MSVCGIFHRVLLGSTDHVGHHHHLQTTLDIKETSPESLRTCNYSCLGHGSASFLYNPNFTTGYAAIATHRGSRHSLQALLHMFTLTPEWGRMTSIYVLFKNIRSMELQSTLFYIQRFCTPRTSLSDRS